MNHHMSTLVRVAILAGGLFALGVQAGSPSEALALRATVKESLAPLVRPAREQAREVTREVSRAAIGSLGAARSGCTAPRARLAADLQLEPDRS